MAKISTKLKVEIVIVLMVIICALIGILFTRKVENYVFKDTAVYFDNGTDFRIEKDDVARKDRESGIINVFRSDGTVLQSSGLPAYLNDSCKAVLLNDMAYLKPISGSDILGYRLSYFTEIEYEKDSRMFMIERGSGKQAETGGFLFDGKDRYVLLEETVMQLNRHTVVLSPMSFVVCYRNNYIEYYDALSNKYETEYLSTDVVITNRNNTYRIRADYDLVIIGNNEIMLQNNLNNYKLYFSESNK